MNDIEKLFYDELPNSLYLLMPIDKYEHLRESQKSYKLETKNEMPNFIKATSEEKSIPNLDDKNSSTEQVIIKIDAKSFYSDEAIFKSKDSFLIRQVPYKYLKSHKKYFR